MDKTFKALADPNRRRVLELLRDRDMTAGELANQFSISKPTLSKHFQILQAADLIIGTRNGTFITYSLNVSVLEEALIGFMNFFKMDWKKGKQNEESPSA